MVDNMLLESLEKLIKELKEENLYPTKKKVVKLMEKREIAEQDRKKINEYLEIFHDREEIFIPINKFKYTTKGDVKL